MTVLLAQVVIPFTTAIPGEEAVNTFHFQTPSTTAIAIGTDITTASAWLWEWYATNAGGSTHAPGEWWAGKVNEAGVHIKWYNLDDPLPRAPITDITVGTAIGSLGSYPIPFEVALCNSFRSDYQSGVNKACFRNRFFLGPLCNTALTASGTDPRPDTALITAMQYSNNRLANKAGSPTWVTYSQKLADMGAGADDGAFPLHYTWVDNEWDTQRRRGLKATARNQQTV